MYQTFKNANRDPAPTNRKITLKQIFKDMKKKITKRGKKGKKSKY